MKNISKQHYERMCIMSKRFEIKSKTSSLFHYEYETSNEINTMIRTIEKPSKSDFNKIERLILNIENTDHYSGSQWHDYKIHLNAVLIENGFTSSIL